MTEPKRISRPVVVLHIDPDGFPTLHACGEAVDVYWVDERAQCDRVYRMTERQTAEHIAEVLGPDEAGHAGDGRYPNLAQAVAARGGKPTLVKD